MLLWSKKYNCQAKRDDCGLSWQEASKSSPITVRNGMIQTGQALIGLQRSISEKLIQIVVFKCTLVSSTMTRMAIFA